MTVPQNYVGLLSDELAPFGLAFVSARRVSSDSDPEDEQTTIVFEADPESFVAHFNCPDIVGSYGDRWPPESLKLWIDVDDHNNVTHIDFETHDLLEWAASTDSALESQLNNLDDPTAQAAAVGRVLGLMVAPSREPREFDSL